MAGLTWQMDEMGAWRPRLPLDRPKPPKCGGCSEWDACPCGCGYGWCRVLHDHTSENDECYKA